MRKYLLVAILLAFTFQAQSLSIFCSYGYTYDPNNIGCIPASGLRANSFSEAASLTSIKSSVTLRNGYALTDHEQVFEIANDDEYGYYFHKKYDTVVTSFSATLSDGNVKLQVINQDEAESIMEANPDVNTMAATKLQGNLAGFYIGKLSKYARVTIKFSIAQPLATKSSFWYFNLFDTLGFGSEITPVTNTVAKDWIVDITAVSSTGIAYAGNPSNKYKPRYYESQGLSYAQWKSVKAPIGGWFDIYYGEEEPNEIHAILAKNPMYKNDFGLFVSMLPQLDDYDTQTVKDQLDNGGWYPELNKAIKGEYLFIIDGSYSYQMTQAHFDNLRNVVRNVINYDLPADSYFNIIIYGKQSLKIFKKNSAKLSDKVKKEATEWIDSNVHYHSDGTSQLYDALNAVYNKALINGYARTIYLFAGTGYAEEYNDAVSLIYENRQTTRVCPIGMYKNVDGLAAMGVAGGCEFVQMEQHFQIGLMLLHTEPHIVSTITQYINKIETSWQCFNNKGRILVQDSSSDGSVYGEAYNKFIHLPELGSGLSYCTIDINYYNAHTKKAETKSLYVYPDEAVESDIWHKIGIYEKSLNAEFDVIDEPETYESKEIINQIADLSVRYQTGSKWTVAVSAKQNRGGKYKILPESVYIQPATN